MEILTIDNVPECRLQYYLPDIGLPEHYCGIIDLLDTGQDSCTSLSNSSQAAI